MTDDPLRALQSRLALNRLIDDLVEQAMRSRLGLSETMRRILPALCEATGARGAFIRTFNEDLELTLLRHPADLLLAELDGLLDGMVRTETPPLTMTIGEDHLLVRTLDVAGEWFGCAGILVSEGERTDTVDECCVSKVRSDFRRSQGHGTPVGESAEGRGGRGAPRKGNRSGSEVPHPGNPETPSPASSGAFEFPERTLDTLHELHGMLEVACEEVDNFLFSIRAAREKHRIIMRISNALRHHILNEGLQQAMRALVDGVPIDRLLLICANDENENLNPHVQVYRGGELEIDTMEASSKAAQDPTLRHRAQTLLRANDRSLLHGLGFQGEFEEVLINGIVDTTIVGKIFVTSKAGTFNTHDRDLLSGFAGFVRQRIIDFNKEWRTLSRSFRSEDVARLLGEEQYIERFLAPREAEVAVLYADISGFTRLSEKVLRTPSAVGHLVEAWSNRAVSLVWEHGGVFDKMVGDCIIALFGPPFYERAPRQRLLDAIGCARAIRDMTQGLSNAPGFEHLRGVTMGVSSGVNLAPLFVGRFGPNDNFTGFSSGMNNTARLQGCAARNEVLVMSEALDVLGPGHDLTIGPERCARVKNVEQPLRFRAVE